MPACKHTYLIVLSVSFLTLSCVMGWFASPTSTSVPPTSTRTLSPTETPVPTVTPVVTPTSQSYVPDFNHIVIIIFENKEFDTVIGHPGMGYFNILATAYTLLTQEYAVTHPSLPNYIAMISGDTYGIIDDCENCFIDKASRPDLIEASGRTWKTYQESMPTSCFIGNTLLYYQKHNPFIYLDPIRLDENRCASRIIPLTKLDEDIASSSLPNFVFITPNACHSSHDCPLELAVAWLDSMMDKLVPALDSDGEPYLIIISWDEGEGFNLCCGLSELAGGRIATILVSPQVKNGFKDDTGYSHYSIIKTIAAAWGLSYLGHAADAETEIITAPWK